MKRQDFIAWEGASLIDGGPVAVIVTGVSRPSANGKTGPMIQTWILRADQHPKEAVKTGDDSSICGTCSLRGTGDGTLRSCYVRVETGPAAVWRKYTQGGYARPGRDDWASVLKGRDIRLGAYGDPTAAPVSVWYTLLDGARTWSGYTHRWRELSLAGRAEPWRAILMASVESEQQAHDAQRLGWRPFLALPDGEPEPEHAFLCPAEREDNPLLCMTCGACAGTKYGSRKTNAPYPWLRMHGKGRMNYLRLVGAS